MIKTIIKPEERIYKIIDFFNKYISRFINLLNLNYLNLRINCKRTKNINLYPDNIIDNDKNKTAVLFKQLFYLIDI